MHKFIFRVFYRSFDILSGLFYAPRKSVPKMRDAFAVALKRSMEGK